MKNMSKILMIVLLTFIFAGCSCKNEKCNCPTEPIDTNEEKYTTISSGYREKYQQTVRSVVMIRVQKISNGEVKTTGSGVVYFEEGVSAYILTNAHVIRDAHLSNEYEVEVIFSDNEGFPSGDSEIAAIEGADYKEDVAVLEIKKSSKYAIANIGDSSKVQKGDFVYTIGSPEQKFNHTTFGTISNYNVKVETDSSGIGIITPVYAIISDAVIHGGNSGGALFNIEGQLIGITTLKYTNIDGMYGSLPINYFIKVAKNILGTGNSYIRPTLNIKTLSINNMGTLREIYEIGNNVTKGVYVQNSFVESIAPQSVITSVNGVIVNYEEEFQVEILKYSVGDTVTLTLINKDGLNNRQVNVTLGQ